MSTFFFEYKKIINKSLISIFLEYIENISEKVLVQKIKECNIRRIISK